MSELKVFKEVSSLPATLVPNGMYLIRNGAGFDMKVADVTGKMAHSLNTGGLTTAQSSALERFIAQIGTGDVINVANVTDVANLATGAATTLKIESFSGNSQVGGGIFVKVDSRTAVKNGVIIASKDGNKFQRMPLDGYFCWEDFGWTPRETSSNQFLADIQPIIASYGGRMRLPREGNTIYMNGNIFLNGLTAIDGNKCTWMWRSEGNVISHAIRTSATPLTYNHGINIFNMVIRYRDEDTANKDYKAGGIWIWGANEAKVYNNDIYSYKLRGILVRCTTADFHYGCKVFGNSVITKDPLREDIHCIEVDSDGMPAGKMDDWYNANHNIKTVPKRGSGHEIYNNYCADGYYGIVFSQVDDCHAYDNKVYGNVRGIVMQNNCNNCSYKRNRMRQFISSAMLCNYGCKNNVYEGNHGISSVANNQAPIQMTIGAEGNTIRDNHFWITSDSGPRWFIYLGIDAVNNIIEGNSYTGNLQSCGILLESAWTARSDRLWSYGRLTNLTTMSSKPTSGNIIRQNMINSPSTCPAIVLHADVDTQGAFNLVDNVLRDNLIRGLNHSSQLLMVEDGTAKILGQDMMGNIYPSGLAASKWVTGHAGMYANIGKCTNRPSASWEGSPVVATNADIPYFTTADASTGVIAVPASQISVVMINQPAAATQLTKMTGGKLGQIVFLRYASGISVKHDKDFLRLMGNTDSPSLDASKLSVFVCISGSGAVGNNSIWSETSRN